MTWVDVVVVALPLAFALLGLFHGFVRQAASWGGLILGHLAGIRYYPAVRDALALNLPRGNEAVAYLAAFVAVYIAARLLGLLVERWIRESRLSGVERLAGGAAGLAKGALLAILFVFLLTVALPKGYEPLARSRYAPRALDAGAWLSRHLPDAVGGAFRAGVGAPRKDDGPAGRDAGAPGADQSKNRPRK